MARLGYLDTAKDIYGHAQYSTVRPGLLTRCIPYISNLTIKISLCNRLSAKELDERRKKLSVLTGFSDASRRTSCISTLSSPLHLDPSSVPPPPMRGYSATAANAASSHQEPPTSNGKAHTPTI
jgi:hypothetical protein